MDQSQSNDALWHDRLVAAASKLHEVGSPELAAAVNDVLNAWGRLRQPDPAAKRGQNNITINASARQGEHIKRAAKEAGDRLTDRVNEGFRLFVSGEFVPDRPKRAPKGTASDRVALNVTPDKQLRARVATRCEELESELGWKLNPRRVALAYLKHLYPLPQARSELEG